MIMARDYVSPEYTHDLPLQTQHLAWPRQLIKEEK